MNTTIKINPTEDQRTVQVYDVNDKLIKEFQVPIEAEYSIALVEGMLGRKLKPGEGIVFNA